MIYTILWILLGVAVFGVVGTIVCNLWRTVTMDLRFSELFEGCVITFTRWGFDGSRVFIHHRPTGTLLVVRKTLEPERSRHGTVRLWVRKLHLRDIEKFKTKSRRSMWPIRGHGIQNRFFWRVPREADGDLVEEVACKNSIPKVVREITRMIKEDPAIGLDAVFDVWGVRCIACRSVGEFED